MKDGKGYSGGAYCGRSLGRARSLRLPAARGRRRNVQSVLGELGMANVLTLDVERGKSLTESNLQAQVDAYNAASTDDQERIYFDEVPAIEEAPAADLYMVVQSTNVIAEQVFGVPRSELASRRTSWNAEAVVQGGNMGEPCVLYVDRAPPAPAPGAPVNPYVRYALYEVDVGTDAVICEEHATADTFYQRHEAYGLSIEAQNGASPADPWKVVSGQLYTAP